MEPKDFIEKRIVLQNCTQPQANGKTCIVVDADRDDDGNIRLYTDLPSPNNPNKFILATTDQIAYYKVFSHWIAQYRKPNGETLNNSSLHVFHNDVLEGCQLVGGFDVFKKIVPKINP